MPRDAEAEHLLLPWGGTLRQVWLDEPLRDLLQACPQPPVAHDFTTRLKPATEEWPRAAGEGLLLPEMLRWNMDAGGRRGAARISRY